MHAQDQQKQATQSQFRRNGWRPLISSCFYGLSHIFVKKSVFWQNPYTSRNWEISARLNSYFWTLRKSFFHYFYLSGLCCDDCCCCCWWPPRPRPRPRWPPLPPTSSLIVYSGGWWQRKCRRVSMDCRKRCFHKLLALDSCHQGRGCCWSLCCCCCASTSEAAASSSPQLSRRPSLCQSWEVELQDQKHVVLSL